MSKTRISLVAFGAIVALSLLSGCSSSMTNSGSNPDSSTPAEARPFQDVFPESELITFEDNQQLYCFGKTDNYDAYVCDWSKLENPQTLTLSKASLKKFKFYFLERGNDVFPCIEAKSNSDRWVTCQMNLILR